MNIDHIVWATPHLDTGITFIHKLLGKEPIPGGQHPGKGTHNALVPMENNTYLEIIAPIYPKPPKCWMDIHLITEPRVIRWALKSTQLRKKVAHMESQGIHMGSILSGERVQANGASITWELTDPDAYRTEKIIPFLIDWKGSPHPTAGRQCSCKLIGIKATHPHPLMMKHILARLGAKIDICKGSEPGLRISISSPKGLVKL